MIGPYSSHNGIKTEMSKLTRRQIAANTALIVFSLVFAMALAEISLRIIGFTYPTTWRFDNITGKSLLPNAQMWNTTEGHAFVQINSDGLRDYEHAVKKPTDTIRIAILGDSYAEAIQVPVDKTFWKILEQKLSDCSGFDGKNIEVINFGVSGFGTVQEFLTLKHKVWKYSPDIVLLAFLTGNDVRNNLRELQQGGNQPYYIYENGALTLDDSYLQKFKSRLRGSILGDFWFSSLPRSRVLQLMVGFSNYLEQRKFDRTEKVDAKRVYERGLSMEVYQPPSDPIWAEAWKVTEDLLRMMNTEVIEHSAEFVLVTLSNGSQVNPDINERTRIEEYLKIDDLLYPDRRLQNFADQEGVRSIILAPRLQDWTLENGECVHGFENADSCGGHWNELGHNIAGTIIAEDFCQRPPRS